MLYWIFDLDNTLYQIPENQDFNYNHVKFDIHLLNILKTLPGRKILFTNGTHDHSKFVLTKMGLQTSFHLIVNRTIMGTIKPDPNAFVKLINWAGITSTDNCLFFEDSIYNIMVAKQFGWKTIYVGPHHHVIKTNSNVNPEFAFPDIKYALTYLTQILRK